MNHNDERDHAEEAANQALLDEARERADWPSPSQLAELDQWDAFLKIAVDRAAGHMAQCPTPGWCLGPDVADVVVSMDIYQRTMCLQVAFVQLTRLRARIAELEAGNANLIRNAEELAEEVVQAHIELRERQ